MTRPAQGILVENAVIANGGTVSSPAVDLGDLSLCGLIVPVMTGTALTFQVSVDGTNFYVLHDSTKAAFTVTVDGTARAFYLTPQIFAGWKYIKVVSGSAEGAERTIKVIAVQAASKR